jgi:geranylgeranyl diphosphate synthase type I
VQVAAALRGRHGALARAHYGTSLAMLAGDVQHGWALASLCRLREHGVSPAVTAALAERMCGWLTPALISGEALDVEYSLRTTVTPAEVERMTRLKTGALLRYSAEAGAMIGLGVADAADPRVAALGRFAELAGVAFQLQDDLLGVYGSEAETGKPAGSDLREGKRTLLYLTALARTRGAQRIFLASLLGARPLSSARLERARRLMTACGADAHVRRRAARLAAEAQRLLEAFPLEPYHGLLTQWLACLVNRSS